MVEGFIFFTVIGGILLGVYLIYGEDEYSRCYKEMEEMGIASMGCCSGLYCGEGRPMCMDCPRFIDVSDTKEENNEWGM